MVSMVMPYTLSHKILLQYSPNALNNNRLGRIRWPTVRPATAGWNALSGVPALVGAPTDRPQNKTSDQSASERHTKGENSQHDEPRKKEIVGGGISDHLRQFGHKRPERYRNSDRKD